MTGALFLPDPVQLALARAGADDADHLKRLMNEIVKYTEIFSVML